MHDLAHFLGELIAPAPQAETGAREVAANRNHALGIGVTGAEQEVQRTLDPGRRLVAICASHEGIHTTVGAL